MQLLSSENHQVHDYSNARAPAPGVNYMDYVDILKRRIWTVLAVAALVIGAGLLVTLHAKPVYESSAELLVDESAATTSQIDANNPFAVFFPPTPAQSISTQIELLNNSPLIDQAIEENGGASVAISQVGDTNIIDVTSDSSNPKAAAGVPNTLLRLYVHDRAEKSLADINAALAKVTAQRNAAQRQWNKANAAILSWGPEKTFGGDLTSSQAAERSRYEADTTQANSVAFQLASTNSQIAQLASLQRAAPGGTDHQDRMNNAQLASIEDSINQLKMQRASKLLLFAPTSEEVRDIDTQIASQESNLAQQPRAIDILRQTSAQQSAQLGVLQQQIAAEKSHLGQYVVWSIKLNQLEDSRSAAANELSLCSDSVQKLTLREQAYKADSHIVSLAPVPSMPMRPNKSQNMIFAVFLGLFLGLCAALVQDFLDDRIKSGDDAQRVLGLPTIGRIPLIQSGGSTNLLTSSSQDYLTESFRMLRTNINFASVDREMRTIVFTSAGIGEGKTTTLANVAIAMAMDAKRVAIVDADLRRPSIHRILNTPRAPGVTDVLSGACTLEEAWHRDERFGGLSVLTAGTEAPNPAEMLNSRAFLDLIERIKAEADIVLIDSPPMIVSDAQILASRADGTVLVVEPGSTVKTRVKKCVEGLYNAHANLIGMAINKAVIPKHEYHQYNQYS